MAEASGVSIPTIKRLEAADGELGGRPETGSKIVAALEAAGVEFLNHGQPGVRLRRAAIDNAKPAGRATDAFSAMEEAVRQDRGKAGSRGKRLASIKETGEELPQEQWERFEQANRKLKP